MVVAYFLVAYVRCVVLLHRLDAHTLATLRRICQDGEVDLPNGERVKCHPNFQLIALGSPPVTAEDARDRYIGSNIGLVFHHLDRQVATAKSMSSLTNVTLDAASPDAKKQFNALLTALENVGIEFPELRLSVRQITKALGHVAAPDSNIVTIMENIVMFDYLSEGAKKAFRACVKTANLEKKHKTSASSGGEEKVAIVSNGTHVRIGNETAPTRNAVHKANVPNPFFQENHSQLCVLMDMMKAYNLKNPILLIGTFKHTQVSCVARPALVNELMCIGVSLSLDDRSHSHLVLLPACQ